jgi:hypothetical protein
MLGDLGGGKGALSGDAKYLRETRAPAPNVCIRFFRIKAVPLSAPGQPNADRSRGHAAPPRAGSSLRRRQTVEPLRKSPPRTSPAIPLRIRLRKGSASKVAGFYSATRDRVMPPLHGLLLLRRVQSVRWYLSHTGICGEGRQPIELTPTRLLRLSKDLPHDRFVKVFGAEAESLMMDRHDEMSAGFIGHLRGLFRSAVRMNPGILSADRHDRQIEGTGSAQLRK